MKKVNFLRYFFISVTGLFVVLISSCIQNKASDIDRGNITFHVRNKLDFKLEDHVIEINLSSLKIPKAFDNFPYTILSSNDTIKTYDVIDSDGDNTLDRLLLRCNFNAHEKKEFRLIKSGIYEEKKKQNTTKYTQAELAVKTKGKWVQKKTKTGNFQYVYEGGEFTNISSLQVPKEHTENSSFIKYEGLGWESEKIGFRMYLDWRNAIDIFGKTKNGIVLQNVGLDGFESYHFMEDWGMDILKVGSSLGIGSIGFWDKNKAIRIEKADSTDCSIVLNGTLKSIIETNYYGWQIDSSLIHLISRLSINGGSRITRQDIVLDKDLNNICTGIVKHSMGKIIQPEVLSNTKWSYFATYGQQSLNNDNLGLFILYNTNDIIDIVEDSNNFILLLKPSNKKLTYYFGAAWTMEENGIKSKKAFLQYLQKQVSILNTPLDISSK